MKLRTAPEIIAVGSAGLVSFACGIASYAARGFASYLLWYWLIGIVLTLAAAFAAARRSRLGSRTALQIKKHQQKQFLKAQTVTAQTGLDDNDNPDDASRHGLRHKDWLVFGLLIVVFAPLYIINAHNFPRQMNTDEIVIMSTARTLAAQPNVDIFGPSYYSDLPTFIFWLLGKIGVAIGGATLGNMRMIHAGSAVIIIGLVFLLLRYLALARPAALAGAATVGLCHSFFFLGRMGMRDNTAVLFEVLALILLYVGWRRLHYGWTLLGGFVLGLCFYTYYPSRITVVLWLAFVAVSLLKGRFAQWRAALRLVVVALVGAAAIAAPLFIANSKHIPTDPYPANQFLWQKAAQQQEKAFRGTDTVREAIEINIRHGLAAFNKPYDDQGMLYIHPGYGFVDSATGVLIWVGLAVVLVSAFLRRKVTEAEILAVTSFLICYLSLAFLLTRAPDYTRLMIVLPFVGYLVGRAAAAGGTVAAGLFSSSSKLSRLGPWLAAALVIALIATANGLIVQNYVKLGNLRGDGAGDTLRFQEKHNNENADWLFVYDEPSQYFYWGIPTYWQFWLNFVPGQDRPVVMYTSQQFQDTELASATPKRTGYILATGEVWLKIKDKVETSVNVLDVTRLDDYGNRVVVHYTLR